MDDCSFVYELNPKLTKYDELMYWSFVNKVNLKTKKNVMESTIAHSPMNSFQTTQNVMEWIVPIHYVNPNKFHVCRDT